MTPPADRAEWLGLSVDPLEPDAAARWAVVPSCGAVVTFTGHARDHSPGRPGVSQLHYEAYEEQVVPSFERVVADVRHRWPSVGRVAVLHRVGRLAVGDTAVVVAVSAPHRDDAFEAARHTIDAVKATAPIWKREVWQGGDDWGLESSPAVGADA